ncbi:phospholipase A1-like [Ctenocephalides felis]|uniref:phospholipase A1-like n=1 Tax=Ctenocephalides felis TaxID=7515 RepID=UPI000E6E21EC|nr:phospholipase A1-like [Ctenocephalides felis]
MFRVSILFVVLFVGIQGNAIGLAEDYANDKEYMMFPDGEGKLHLIHLKEDKYQPQIKFNVNKHMNFLLYTRENPDEPQVLKFKSLASIRESNFAQIHETFFVTHGWKSGPKSSVNILIKNALLKAGDYNVIVVDWKYGASYNYFAARGHAATAGKHLGNFLNFLVKEINLRLKTVHLIGHSLGAHVMGFAGKTIRKENKGQKVGQIVGLDPALPLYTFGNPGGRLELNDAQYVEIIHTNGGKLGFLDAIGHADYYPNWGSTQPGCGLDMFGSCAHARAYEYYAESIIRSAHFQSKKCRDLHQLKNDFCTDKAGNYLMGGMVNQKERYFGIFILQTAEKSPFGLGYR